MSTILAFHHITKSYGNTLAVSDVSFDVPEGEVFGLLGPNGAGKTTLIRTLMDIIRADKGQIQLFGGPLDRDQLDRIGYLPEERGLYKKQKVAEVLTYFGQLKGLAHGDAKKRALLWLEKIQLPEVASWQVERLSKGMAQKVQIAAALLFEPPLAILDEPFSGLDPVNVRLIQEIIRDRRRAGLSTILSTHQMDMVETLCDRIALINKGTLMEYGLVDEVRRRWSRPEVLVTTGNGEPPMVPGVIERHPHGNGAAAWRMLLAEGTAPSGVLAALVRADVQIERFEKLLTPMEDVFINVVQGVVRQEVHQ